MYPRRTDVRGKYPTRYPATLLPEGRLAADAGGRELRLQTEIPSYRKNPLGRTYVTSPSDVHIGAERLPAVK